MQHYSTVYVLIGCPASGKTTHAVDLNETVVSSDKIREELYGDESIQGNSREVFEVFYNKARKIVSTGDNVILDATNLTKENRRHIFEALKDYPCRYIAVRHEVPLESLLRRNKLRDRQVPESTIKRMYKQYEPPSMDEGFEEIWSGAY